MTLHTEPHNYSLILKKVFICVKLSEKGRTQRVMQPLALVSSSAFMRAFVHTKLFRRSHNVSVKNAKNRPARIPYCIVSQGYPCFSIVC